MKVINYIKRITKLIEKIFNTLTIIGCYYFIEELLLRVKQEKNLNFYTNEEIEDWIKRIENFLSNNFIKIEKFEIMLSEIRTGN